MYRGRLPIYNLLRCVAGSRVIGSIVPPFSERNSFASRFLRVCSHASKIGLQSFVSNLGLAICLRMVCSEEIEIHPVYTEKFFPNSTQENTIHVADDGMWHLMQFEYVIHEALGHLNSGVRVRQGQKVGVLNESMYDN